MPNRQASMVLQHLQGAGLMGETMDLTDGLLLERFVSQGKQADLTTLVQRPGSAGALATILSEKAAPASIVGSTLQTINVVAAGSAETACGISAAVAALTKEISKAILLNRLKAVTVVLALLGACVVAAGTGMLGRQPEPAQPTPEMDQGAVQPLTAIRYDMWSEEENGVVVVDLATGAVRARFRGHRGELKALAFSADGRALATGSEDGTALLWDLVGRREKERLLSANELCELWDRLGSDAAAAHQAMAALTRADEQTVAWVWEHLPRLDRADGVPVTRLIQNLDDDSFVVREEAEAALERLAESAAPALRQALAGNPGAEVRRRVTRLLEQLNGVTTPARLRSLRAIEVLERLGTADARKVLADVAGGMPEALRTQEAKASLGRLAWRK
jgi:hypothetical protein